jgi:hypothetical protein
MIMPTLSVATVRAFQGELVKIAKVTPATVALGALAGGSAGALAHKHYTKDERSKDELLRDLKRMPEKTYQARRKERGARTAGAAALGAMTGAGAPVLYREAARAVGRAVDRTVKPTLQTAKSGIDDSVEKGVAEYDRMLQRQADYLLDQLRGPRGARAAETLGESARKGFLPRFLRRRRANPQ